MILPNLIGISLQITIEGHKFVSRVRLEGQMGGQKTEKIIITRENTSEKRKWSNALK